MKINIQKLARVIAPVVSVFVIVLLCVMPASASNIDYNDLISNVVVDGDNDLVTVSVPDLYLLSQIVDGGTGEALVTVDGGYVSCPVNADYPYSIIFYAFQNGTDHLLLDNIPNDTAVTFVFYISNYSGLSYNTPALFSDWYYFGSDSQYLGMSRVEHGNMPVTGEFSISQKLAKIDGTKSGSFNFTFYHLTPFNSGNLSVELKSLTFTFSISSLYRLQQQTGKTNEILAEVQKQLEANGQKLEDIINGSSDQQNQAGQFKDGIGSVSGALDGAGGVISGVPKPTIVVDDLVPSDVLNGSAYLTYVTTIQEFWKSETLSSVTVILGGLILVSYILFGEKG